MKSKLNFGCKKLILVIMTGFFLLSGVCAQPYNITGTVTDSDNVPIPGVNVFIRGTTTGTVTDLDGMYSINVRSEEAVIVFSTISYQTEEILVGTQRIIDVVLTEDTKSLDEVVVIGYGTQKKSDLTGAVSTVDADELTKLPTGSLENTLQGRVSGLQVTRTTGAPGASTSVRIRGVSSFNGGQALWVIDGVPGSPGSVNASDIESIEILKDASTAAIYGSAGANGVILVTTKKGAGQRMDVNFNAYYGVQQVGKMLDLPDGPTMAHYINEAELIKGVSPRRLTFPDHASIDTLPTFDHVGSAFRTAPIQGYNLGLSNGSDNSSMYFGLGYFNQDGIVHNSNFKRLNLRLNSELKVKEWLTIGENISFENSVNTGFDEWVLTSEYHGPIIHAATFMPFQPVFTEEGEYISDMFGHSNPRTTIDHSSNRSSISNSGKVSAYAILQPFRGLSIQSRWTGDVSLSDNKSFSDIYAVIGSTQRNDRTSLNAGISKNIGWRTQNTVTYTTTIQEIFNLSVMAGQEAGYGKWQNYYGTRKDLLNTSEEMWYPNASVDAATDTLVVPDRFFQGTGEENAFYSYFGRLSFDYKSKYLFQANIRQDQSSRFGPENRSGIFPSFSTGWKFSEESFMDGIDWLSFGKVRYGWGQAGNDNISPYGFYSTVLFNPTLDYSFNNGQQILVGAAPNQLVNKAVHWETIVTSNLGIDLAFWRNKLTITADYFTRENEEMLMRVNVPSIAGWDVFFVFQEGGEAVAFRNIGKLRNSGIELSAGYKEVITPKFSFDLQANYTYIENTVVDIKDDTLYNGGVRGVTGYITRTHSGSGIGDYYGRVTEGIFSEEDGYYDDEAGVWIITNQPFYIDEESGEKVYARPNARPGDYRWKDINGDGRIDDRDREVLGNPHPKHLLGLNFNFRYGILDLSMFWQGAFGHQIMNGLKAYLLGEATDGTKNLPMDFIENHFRNDVYSRDADPVLLYPAIENPSYARYDIYNRNQNFDTFSDIYIEDGDYLRLKTIQLGVRLPDKVLRRIDMGNIRLYVNATNLLTFTKYTGLDPELNTRNPLNAGIDNGVYPLARTFTAGIDVKF